MDPAYDTIGQGYARVRRADPRLEAFVRSALGDARTLVNVGAGAGSYEPRDRTVVAVEPSDVMISQRPHDAAPVVRGVAEALPLGDDAVDAALAVFTLQHWSDAAAGLREMVRVARERAVIVTIDVDVLGELWLVRDYVPETLTAHASVFPPIQRLLETLPNASAVTIPVPRDCTDGFMAAYWARPEAYLDPAARAGTSVWHQLPPPVVARALRDLGRDLTSGGWDRRYGHLRTVPALDVGVRVVTSLTTG